MAMKRRRALTCQAKVIKLLRSAQTKACAKYGISGQVKRKQPAPITLPMLKSQQR
jgi:hypothetical protein